MLKCCAFFLSYPFYFRLVLIVYFLYKCLWEASLTLPLIKINGTFFGAKMIQQQAVSRKRIANKIRTNHNGIFVENKRFAYTRAGHTKHKQTNKQWIAILTTRWNVWNVRVYLNCHCHKSRAVVMSLSLSHPPSCSFSLCVFECASFRLPLSAAERKKNCAK